MPRSRETCVQSCISLSLMRSENAWGYQCTWISHGDTGIYVCSDMEKWWKKVVSRKLRFKETIPRNNLEITAGSSNRSSDNPVLWWRHSSVDSSAISSHAPFKRSDIRAGQLRRQLRVKIQIWACLNSTLTLEQNTVQRLFFIPLFSQNVFGYINQSIWFFRKNSHNCQCDLLLQMFHPILGLNFPSLSSQQLTLVNLLLIW